MPARRSFNATPTTTATRIVSARPGRIGLTMKNVGSVTVYIGPDSTVTTSTGFPLDEDEVMEDEGYTDEWWGITGSGTGDIRGFEVD